MNLSALNHTSYRRYFFGGVLAVNGMWILQIVVTWLAWEITRSASFVGLVGAIALVPTVLTGPFFGAMADRTNILIAAFITNFLMVLCTLVLLVVEVMDATNPIWLISVALALGIVKSAHHPIRLSLAPRLVDREAISSVVTLSALNFNTARVFAPIIAGFLIAQYGVVTALWIAAICYVPALIILCMISPREREISKASPSLFAALIEGYKYIQERRFIINVLLLTGMASFAIRGVLELLPLVADGQFNKGAIGLGQLASSVGFGSLSAAIWKAIMAPQQKREIPKSTWIILLAGIAGVIVFGNSTLWIIALISAAGLGFASTILGISLQSAVQMDLPDELRGRVMSIWIVVAMGSSALGALIVGIISDYLGFSNACIIVAIVIFSATLLMGRFRRT